MIASKLRIQLLEERLNDLSRGRSLRYWNNGQTIPLSLLRWWISLLTLPVKVQLDQTRVVSWLKFRFLPENARGFSLTNLRYDLLISLPRRRRPIPSLVLLTRAKSILLNNRMGRSLRLNRGPQIALFLPRLFILRGILKLVPLVLKLWFRRPKRRIQKIWVSLLIQRPLSCLTPTLHFLYLLNQWLTMSIQSGRLTVVKSQLRFLAIRCGIR